MSDVAKVAVVGAGPAGSTAAEAAAAAGAEVLLIERKREIGTPVQCGGFLPEAAELKELLPHASLPQPLLDLPDRCVLHRTKLQRLYAPSGRSKEFPVEARVVDRRAFDRYLAQRAARAGARILPATRARLAAGDLRLTGRSSMSIRPEVIIGADGPSSGIARGMGNRGGDRGICLQYEMADVAIDPGAAELYFSARHAPGGYAWIIPLGQDTANVGIGVRSAYMGEANLRQLLESFITDHLVAREKLRRGEVLAVMRGLVPASGTAQALQKDNLLLAGDAAGQVMATSGGGIPLAVVAGRIAGETAAAYINEEAALGEYPSRVYQELGRELERSVRIRKMVDGIMRRDRLMNALFAALEPDHMKAVMRAQIPDALNVVGELVR
jgi:digeranylgeranylglycerophospholipid reductase